MQCTIRQKQILDTTAIINWPSLEYNFSALAMMENIFCICNKQLSFRNSTLTIQQINGKWKKSSLERNFCFFSSDSKIAVIQKKIVSILFN